MQFYMGIKNTPVNYWKGAILIDGKGYVPDPFDGEVVIKESLQLITANIPEGPSYQLFWFTSLGSKSYRMAVKHGHTYILDYTAGIVTDSGGEDEGTNWMPWAVGGGVLALIAGAVIIKNRKK